MFGGELTDVLVDDDRFTASSRRVRAEFEAQSKCGRKQWCICGGTSALLGFGSALIAVGAILLVFWHTDATDSRDASIRTYNAAVSQWQSSQRELFEGVPQLKVLPNGSQTNYSVVLLPASHASETPASADSGTFADAVRPTAYAPLDFESPPFAVYTTAQGDCFCTAAPGSSTAPLAASSRTDARHFGAGERRALTGGEMQVVETAAEADDLTKPACACVAYGSTCDYKGRKWPHIGSCDGHPFTVCSCDGCSNRTACGRPPTPTPPAPTPAPRPTGSPTPAPTSGDTFGGCKLSHRFAVNFIQNDFSGDRPLTTVDEPVFRRRAAAGVLDSDACAALGGAWDAMSSDGEFVCHMYQVATRACIKIKQQADDAWVPDATFVPSTGSSETGCGDNAAWAPVEYVDMPVVTSRAAPCSAALSGAVPDEVQIYATVRSTYDPLVSFYAQHGAGVALTFGPPQHPGFIAGIALVCAGGVLILLTVSGRFAWCALRACRKKQIEDIEEDAVRRPYAFSAASDDPFADDPLFGDRAASPLPAQKQKQRGRARPKRRTDRDLLNDPYLR